MKYYEIVTGNNLTDLEVKVNRECERGWVPQGGVQIVALTYAQAMIKPTKDTQHD